MDAMSAATSAAGPGGQVRIGTELFQVRDLRAEDQESLLRLHVNVFGPGATPAWYEWKYAAGGGLGSGVWHEGELIAHCGGVPRPLWRQGRRETGIQIGDVMVAPQWRGILSRRGPFFQASRAFYSAHVGERQGHAIAFGFPSERHLRLAVTLKLLWDAGPVHALTWDLQAKANSAPAWAWQSHSLDPSDLRFDARVDAAWQRMRGAATALTLGERDARYVRWRFCERPQRRCHFLAVRRPWSRTLAGIAVLDLTSADAQWLDWIGDPAAIVAASRACIAHAGRAGARSLSAWTSPLVTQSLRTSGVAHQSVIAWLGIPRASSLTEQEVAGMPWWLMGGDTDFL